MKALFSAPTALRAIHKEDPEGAHAAKYDLSALRYLFQAGERLDRDTHAWASQKLAIPVVDHWWQTATGWAIAANPMGVEPMPIKAGSATVPMPGYEVRILRPDGSECAPSEEGAICIRLPQPPGTLPTLWCDDDRYVASYLSEHPGYYLSGDGGYLDEHGYLFVMGRTDDVINVAGHRLSTGAIKGHVPRGFVVLKAGACDDGLADELVQAVRAEIGAVACLKRVEVVTTLPKTRSGKVLRRAMRGIADGLDEPVPSKIQPFSNPSNPHCGPRTGPGPCNTR